MANIVKQKKIMGLWDIVLMNVVAMLGIRWLPIAAKYGAASTAFWLIAALLYFIPSAFVVAELACMPTNQRGLYDWVRQAFGDKTAFFITWFYTINFLLILPTVITFVGVTFAFLLKPTFAQDPLIVYLISIGALWLVVLANLRDLRLTKWIIDAGGVIGMILPGLLILLFSGVLVFVYKYPIPTGYHLSNWIPHLTGKTNIAFLSTLMFSMAGIELSSAFSAETENAQRVFSKAIFISALVIVGIYVLGTTAVTFVIPPDHISASAGIVDTINIFSQQLGLPIILPVLIFLLIFGQLGGACPLLIGPIKMFIKNAEISGLPKFLTQTNKKGTPVQLILIEAIIISVIFLIGALLSSSVDRFFETLTLMTSISYFIPISFIFLSFLKLKFHHPNINRPYKVPGGKIGAFLICLLGMSAILLGVTIPFTSPPDDIVQIHEILAYRLSLFLGPMLLFIFGYLVYLTSKLSKRTKL